MAKEPDFAVVGEALVPKWMQPESSLENVEFVR